ncbi:hypothetical protein ACQKQD_18800 [Methylobacterium sp. NPDC080182]|uniref:hypothetical protein n=1 Tax=Methylobacterium sp. NPDC080182 TaxID=3390590 RepID=UPI003D0069E2
MPETLPADITAAIAAFAEAAQRHGWEADQGSARDADVAEREYAARLAELQKAIGRLARSRNEMKAALEAIEAGR